ncbi:MAG: helix-turn-helix domain-containing protein [Pirellulales bacterium]|nr:helix-turn-helix domain-containing protein [Pirellulales bacterium]
MNVSTLFKQFQQLTDDQSAALLTLAAVIAKAQPDELLTVKQVAARLAVSPDAVYEMVESGKLSHQRIGKGRGTIRIRPSDLDAFQPQPIKLRRLVG